MEEINYEKKYRALKKKYKTVTADKDSIDQQLSIAKKRVLRLQKERSFLLDRLLQYEQVSSDSDTSSSSSDEEEEREREREVMLERPTKRVRKDTSDTPTVRVTVSGERGYPEGRRRRTGPRSRDSGEEQVCIARGKDKPCKSKALQGFKYCWHHAPLDPATGFIFCQYRDANKRNAKKCNIPVHKDKPEPFCNYHVKRLQRQQNVKAHRGENGHNNNDVGVPGGTPVDGGEGYEDGFSDAEDGLDVGSGDGGSGEETSPPQFPGDPNGEFQDNVVVN
jgi:hypothetical protein